MRAISLGHEGPGKSIEEVQQILKKLGMRQAIYTPVFESSGQVTFNAEIKANILRHLVWDTDIHAEPSGGTRYL